MMTSSQQIWELFGIGRLFTLTHEAVVGADLADETIVLWNPGAERMFGYTADEAVGMPLTTIVAEEMRDRHQAGLRRFRDTGTTTLIGGPPVVVPARAKDGSRLMIALTVTVLTTPDAGAYVAAVIRDVTAQKAAEDALQRNHQSMQDFVATAAHDLKAPLTGVIGFAQLLRDHGSQLADADRTNYLDHIVRNGQRAARLVDDLMTVSMIQTDSIDISCEPVDVAAAIGDAATTCGVVADITVEHGLQVAADAGHVQRILINLLTNAQKYGEPPARLVAAANGTDVDIRIRDAGKGIPAHFRDRLFDRFARREEHRDVEGSGLGLAIVQGLTRANGGDVSYEHDGEEWAFAVRLQRVAVR